jgi:hypothetical protein
MAHVQGESLKVIAVVHRRLLNSPTTRAPGGRLRNGEFLQMEQPYSVVADWLSKFHTWPEFIQALWLTAMPVTVLGVTWIVMRGLRDIAAVLRGRGEATLYGVIEDAEGRRLVWRDGEMKIANITGCSDNTIVRYLELYNKHQL